MSEYIFNPVTGRNVLRTGKIGKQLVKKEKLEGFVGSKENLCGICTENCTGINKCKRCNYLAGRRCINIWFDKVGSKSCPGCRHNFVTGKPGSDSDIESGPGSDSDSGIDSDSGSGSGSGSDSDSDSDSGSDFDIDFAYEITVFATRLISAPPRNGHIVEDMGNLLKQMAIERFLN